MVNRYCRDELILNMLLLVQNANLEHDEAPGGVVQPQAMSIQWLQDILDFCYHKSPFSSTVSHTTLNCTPNSDTVTLPADFILDVRDGYLVESIAGDSRSLVRVFRRAFQDFLDHKLSNQKIQQATQYTRPLVYSVVERNATGQQLMQITPTPTNVVNGTLWYYQLPPRLEANDKPVFPSDQVIIEYMRIRALEWMGLVDVGTSLKYEEKLVAGMKAAGLLNEPERNQIPFDTMNYRRAGYNQSSPYSWIGPV